MACGPAWVTLEASGFSPLTGFKNKSSLDVGAHASKETVECGKSSRSRGLLPIRRILILPSERLAAPLKNAETIPGARRTSKPRRLEAMGAPSKQRAVRRVRKHWLDRGA